MNNKTKAIMGLAAAVVAVLVAFGVGVPDWLMSMMGSVPEVPVK